MEHKDYGWVIAMKPKSFYYEKGTPQFYAGPTTRLMAAANVFLTRREARWHKGYDEVVKKVMLDKDGIPMLIVNGR